MNCYAEKEIVLLSLYISDDGRVGKTFKKLKPNSDIIRNILNVAWDLYHVRLTEQIMFFDNMEDKENITLSFFATADNGLLDVMRINPIKAFVMVKGQLITFHEIRMEDVCKNEELLRCAEEEMEERAKRMRHTDLQKIRKQLTEEIQKAKKVK